MSTLYLSFDCFHTKRFALFLHVLSVYVLLVSCHCKLDIGVTFCI